MKIAILTALLVMIFIIACPYTGRCNPPEREYYEIRIYELANKDQEKRLEAYLKDAFVPGLHRLGISKVGVLKPRENDTSSILKLYVLIPYKSFQQFETSMKKLDEDKVYTAAGADYINAPFDNPMYQHIQKIITRAFSRMPVSEAPKLSAPKNERVYELRSYESATEKLHNNKVKMFNDGNEVSIFKRLGFNAVFYSQVLVGNSMPNLVYMISFNNMESHDDLWKKFRDDDEWKKLSTSPEYQHNVSRQEIHFLYPTDYSDL